MEAAAAYYEVTGKDRLLHVMERMAEHIEKRFGTEKARNREFLDIRKLNWDSCVFMKQRAKKTTETWPDISLNSVERTRIIL